MRRPLVVRQEARRDVRETAAWYEDQKAGLAARFIDELDDLLQRIAENPAQFPRMSPEVRRGLLHRFPYAVYFTPGDGDAVDIIAVLHQHRDPDTWKARAAAG
jgi:plasmid stabilization system protein ParE